MAYVPPLEKEIVKEYCLKGAEDAGSSKGIIFLNDKFNMRPEMEIKNKSKNFEEESRLKIRNQSFTNEIDLDQYIEWDALAGIIFVNCRFKELDLLGKVFGSCDFKDCKFNNLSFRKCQFWNCKFENCQIVNSDLTRAEFHDSSSTYQVGLPGFVWALESIFIYLVESLKEVISNSSSKTLKYSKRRGL